MFCGSRTPGETNDIDFDAHRVQFSTPVSYDIPPLKMSLSEPTVVLSDEQVKQLSSDISQSIRLSKVLTCESVRCHHH